LAANARNFSDAETSLRKTGSATLRFRMIADVEVRLFEVRTGQEVTTLDDQPLSSSVVPYSNETIARLKKLVAQRRCILITGVSGIGKTVLLGKLAEAIPRVDGLVRIDPHDELRFDTSTDEWDLTGGVPDTPPIAGSIQPELWHALRVPHRWIVASELPMHSQSINLFLQGGMTGHLTLSTMQANSINDALVALECGLVQDPDMAPDLAKAFVSGGIDVVVHLFAPGPKHAQYIEVAEVRDREHASDQGDYNIVPLPL
jgi:type IV secretory pathway ATPase VirB11/archaellum biosynthesis ATPase